MKWPELSQHTEHLLRLVHDQPIIGVNADTNGSALRERCGAVSSRLVGLTPEELANFDANFPGLRALLPVLTNHALNLRRPAEAAAARSALLALLPTVLAAGRCPCAVCQAARA